MSNKGHTPLLPFASQPVALPLPLHTSLSSPSSCACAPHIPPPPGGRPDHVTRWAAAHWSERPATTWSARWQHEAPEGAAIQRARAPTNWREYTIYTWALRAPFLIVVNSPIVGPLLNWPSPCTIRRRPLDNRWVSDHSAPETLGYN